MEIHGKKSVICTLQIIPQEQQQPRRHGTSISSVFYSERSTTTAGPYTQKYKHSTHLSMYYLRTYLCICAQEIYQHGDVMGATTKATDST